jgi:predicted O-methyltransferase YrrM
MEQWTPERMLGISRGFMESRIVLTAAELDLFSLLYGAPKSLDEVTAALNVTPRGAAILLDALTAMGLLAKADGRYTCPPDVARLLVADSPCSLLPMMRHAAGLWHRWTGLTDIVRHGSVERPAGVFDDPAELAAFIGAMHAIGRHGAAIIAEQVHAEGAKNLLDVGGATGTYAEAFLRKHPGMRATVFDRPPVIELARQRLATTGLLDRIALAAGDFYTDELPGGHDLALLSAIIHQNSPEQNRDLYAKVFRALEPGGRILIRDHVMSPDRTEPGPGALFAVNMLVATSGGNCYTFDEIRSDLEAAGFTRVRQLQSGEMMNALVEAFKP